MDENTRCFIQSILKIAAKNFYDDPEAIWLHDETSDYSIADFLGQLESAFAEVGMVLEDFVEQNCSESEVSRVMKIIKEEEPA